jgi:hypothetical protein
VTPALALPLRTKTVFSCPPEHLEQLRQKLPQVTRVLTIGWKGQDQHFLDELRKAKAGRCEMLIVTKSERGGAVVAEALNRAGVSGHVTEHLGENAFTTLFKSDKLHEFLTRV